MKRLIWIAAFVALCFGPAVVLRAGDCTVRDDTGRLIARIGSDGVFRDASGRRIGAFDGDGAVRGGSGGLVGRIDRGTAVRNASGRLVARLDGCGPEGTHAAAAYLFFFDPRFNR